MFDTWKCEENIDEDYSEPGRRFLKSDTLEQLRHELTPWLEEGRGGYDYYCILENLGVYTASVWEGMPCYGELRVYGDHALPPEQAPVEKPFDLNLEIPEGRPVEVGVRFSNRNISALDLATDPEWSPYKSLNFRRGRKNLIFSDMDIDPTLLIHMLVFIQTVKVIENVPPALALAVVAKSVYSGEFWHGLKGSLFTNRTSLKKWLTGDANDMSEGLKMSQPNVAYNRPKLHHVFDADPGEEVFNYSGLDNWGTMSEDESREFMNLITKEVERIC